jgi:hypothetical protein
MERGREGIVRKTRGREGIVGKTREMGGVIVRGTGDIEGSTLIKKKQTFPHI